MATEIYTTPQTTGEIRTHFVDFTNDLPASGTVSAAAGTLSAYPSGGTATVAMGIITANVVPVTVSAATLAGMYYVDITATLATGDKSVARLIIPVRWADVRATMTDLILELRGMSEAGVNDYTVAGVAFWSDKHLQDILDKKQTEVDYEQMDIFSTRAGSIYEYKEYYTGHTNWEGTPTIRDGYGSSIVGTLYTFEPVSGEVEFTDDQYGSARFISGYYYDVNGAAAEVWRKKMGNAAKMYDFSTDRHNLARSQYMDHCKQMWQFYEGQAGPNIIQIYREDTRPPIEDNLD
jgi:hypothetical protein